MEKQTYKITVATKNQGVFFSKTQALTTCDVRAIEAKFTLLGFIVIVEKI